MEKIDKVGQAFENKENIENIRKKLIKEQRQKKLRKFLSNKTSVIGLAIVVFMVLVALFAPAIAKCSPYDANVMSRLKAPDSLHWFGTDSLGRDIFARTVYGARVSMIVGFTVGLLSSGIGIIVGLHASSNKYLDNILMRICDGLKAIPSIMLAIALMSVLGADIKNVIISLTVVSIPSVARVARASALVVREQTYIDAQRCLGASMTRILWKQIAPNILAPMIVQMTFCFASAIVSEAGLSFLGAGVPASVPSWGGMLSEGKSYIFKNCWWMILFPGLFTGASVLGLNLFGDGLRDFLDPLDN